MFANDARNLSLVNASDSMSPSSDLSSTSDASVAAVELARVRHRPVRHGARENSSAQLEKSVGAQGIAHSARDTLRESSHNSGSWGRCKVM
jgi:hypothetical protein